MNRSVMESNDPKPPPPPIPFSPEQRKALAQICLIHERGLNARRISLRSLLIALYILFCLGFSVLLVEITAFAGPAFLLLGFVVGALLTNLRILLTFRRIWPVYDSVIDWPKAHLLLKSSSGGRNPGESAHTGTAPSTPAEASPPGASSPPPPPTSHQSSPPPGPPTSPE